MNSGKETRWQVWIDTGGTFTDCLARDPAGSVHCVKVLSSSALRGLVERQLTPSRLAVRVKWSAPPDFVRGFQFRLLDTQHPESLVDAFDPADSVIGLREALSIDVPPGAAFEVRSPDEAPILAARLATATPPQGALPAMTMRLGTTRGTNALLERRGVPVALFITRGFGDLLRIGTQQRPDLFALGIRKPEPLYQAVVEVPERMAADGTILRPLHTDKLADDLAHLRREGINVAAVALMHSYANPAHEHALADFLYSAGFRHVSCSCRLAPFIKLLPRAETAVVNAYLSPVIEDYLCRVRSALAGGRLHVMTSAGGLVQSHDFHAKDSLLSGPAGGVVGAALAGRQAGFAKIIAFDMGGTSTDVARYDGDFEYLFEHQVGDAHLVAPALAIESVAAGGGSICTFQDGRLHVGPQSAGAQPGPACYNAGGPLTLTDCNLLLGRLDPDRFEIPISPAPANDRLNDVLTALTDYTGRQTAPEALLEGFLEIANERMADSIRAVSVRRGYDPADYALVAFGGAGAQHACGIAARLGISIILVPQDAGLLSAIGLGHAALERFAERQILQPLAAVHSRVDEWINQLSDEAAHAVADEGVPADDIQIRRRIVNIRFVGQDSVLQIEFDPNVPLQQAFETRYITVFGHRPEGRPVEIESIRVIASSKAIQPPESPPPAKPFEATPARTIRAYFAGRWTRTPAYERADLIPGAHVAGPTLIFEPHTATPIEPKWNADVDAAGTIRLTHHQHGESNAR